MATPEVPPEILDRLTNVEDAVQQSRFSHQVKVDATTNGLSILYAQHQRMQEELSGFRAEVAAEFGSVRSELAEIRSVVAEILRRLPDPGVS